ncbi:hypothetical protein HZ326_10393 [Fusarium oxysporum f. sp. albedinis]|nr:hypothetical protein HZ326_10393 [Fusarium oxysporum f. sp. albedinis]
MAEIWDGRTGLDRRGYCIFWLFLHFHFHFLSLCLVLTESLPNTHSPCCRNEILFVCCCNDLFLISCSASYLIL